MWYSQDCGKRQLFAQESEQLPFHPKAAQILGLSCLWIKHSKLKASIFPETGRFPWHSPSFVPLSLSPEEAEGTAGEPLGCRPCSPAQQNPSSAPEPPASPHKPVAGSGRLDRNSNELLFTNKRAKLLRFLQAALTWVLKQCSARSANLCHLQRYIYLLIYVQGEREQRETRRTEY